jgi:molybdopterin-binding protein
MAKLPKVPIYRTMRVGQAAELLGVSIDTLRRWESAGKLRVRRSAGGQRLVGLADIRSLLAERRRKRAPNRAQSARNRFPGVVTRVEKDRVAAVVEVQAGPHRLVSLMTAEAATELALAPGTSVVCVVKATNVVVEIAQRKRGPTS